MTWFSKFRLWPGKHERRADIEDAIREKEQSQQSAAHAQQIEREIKRVAREDHFAEKIASQLIMQGWKRGS